MKSSTHLDYAIFQLSPKRSRCELFVSSNGNTEKLASGLVKPFVTHLKVAEEQVALTLQSIKLEVEKCKDAETWFTKGTLERFVRFVSTPEVLELVNTFDAEMSQLEAARRMYSQGVGDQPSGASGGDATGMLAAADVTKKELLRAIDVRLNAVQQDLATAFARASAAGFNSDTVSELQHFADWFGAYRLNEACTKFMSLYQRRPELISRRKPGVDDPVVRASWESDMSIDDPNEDQVGSHVNSSPHQPTNKHQEQQLQPNTMPTQHHIEQSKPATSQQAKLSSTAQQCSQNENKEGEKKKVGATESSPSQISQPGRRLSVQDRISLFENKQKESSSTGGKSISVGKSIELRRLSSDVSTAPAVPEKAVLRRWSAASDMSIDMGNDKMDGNTDSPLSMRSSSSASQGNNSEFQGLSEDKEQKDEKDLSDKVSSVKVEPKSVPGRATDFGLKDQGEVQTQLANNLLGKDGDAGLKGRMNWKAPSGSQNSLYRSFTGKLEQAELGDQVVSQEKVKGSLTGERGGSEIQSRIVPGRSTIVGVKNHSASQFPDTVFADAVGDDTPEGQLKNRVEAQGKDQSVSQSHFRVQGHSRTLSGQFEGGIGLKTKEAQYKSSEGDQLAPQQQWQSFYGEVEVVGKKDLASSEKQISKVDNSGFHEMKFKKRVPVGSEPSKKSQGRKDEGGSVYANNKSVFGKMFPLSEENASAPMVPVDQTPRIRQSRGNQELNDELKMKANELEKLFAEHKLRVPADQFSSARRNKPADAQIEPEPSLEYKKTATVDASPIHMPEKNLIPEPMGSLSNMADFCTPPTKMVDNEDLSDSLRRSFSNITFSNDSRGKCYEKYMQKRDAKLREEWGSKRAEKEAKLKTMQDSLEQSRAEMKAKFSGSVDRLDSESSACRRAEKVRSFNFQSQGEQHPISSIQSEDDLSEFPDQKYYGHDRTYNGTSFIDGSSMSFNNKKHIPNRNVSLSTPRTAAAAVPRSAAKVSILSSGRRRVQSENPLVQSVPNFSDLRKENTKPSSGASKTTSYSQVRKYARSKSTNEELALGKDGQHRRSQSLRKISAGPVEYSDLSALNSDDIVLAPMKFDTEQMGQSLNDKNLKNMVMEAQPFLRKGNDIGPGAGVNIAKLKTSEASEDPKGEESDDELAFQADESMDMAKEDEEDELETRALDDFADMENGTGRLSQESGKSDNSGAENDDSLRSLSQVDPASVAELPAAVPATFHPPASLQDSPGESPVSWNSHMHHPFSYPHETSYMMDSPIGSPASWNSHSLAQMEKDAARMRKKWGSSQKPFHVANITHNQSHRDVTKGFKRLLKFGRKSRKNENFLDWISATTSEGDDDIEDVRDPANRSLEDLRKSRMGFSQGHRSEDGFNESELFNDQVQSPRTSIPAPPANFKLREDHMSGSSIKAPCSLFSLSTFRSKGSDSKPR